MTDLMERLRAADPIHEAPAPQPVEPLLARLEESPADSARERPARRALGARVHLPTRGRALSRGRRPLAGDATALGGVGARRLVALPAIVALLALAVVAGLGQRSSPDVVAEARQALGTSSEIIHVVTRLDYVVEGAKGPVTVTLDEDDARPPGDLADRTERWTALDPLRERSRFTFRPRRGEASYSIDYAFADGLTQLKNSDSDEMETESLTEEEYGRVRGAGRPGDPGPDPVAAVRKLLADGELKAAGETTVDGRRVLRLAGQEPNPDAGSKRLREQKVEYLVDAETFVPVRISIQEVGYGISPGKSVRVAGIRRVITFEVFERLPMTPENEALLRVPN